MIKRISHWITGNHKWQEYTTKLPATQTLYRPSTRNEWMACVGFTELVGYCACGAYRKRILLGHLPEKPVAEPELEQLRKMAGL